jgi:hypothetical protein
VMNVPMRYITISSHLFGTAITSNLTGRASALPFKEKNNGFKLECRIG